MAIIFCIIYRSLVVSLKNAIEQDIFVSEDTSSLTFVSKIKYYIYIFKNKHFIHFLGFHTVIETRVDVLENEKLKWKYEPYTRPRSECFYCYF